MVLILGILVLVLYNVTQTGVGAGFKYFAFHSKSCHSESKGNQPTAV